MLTPTYILCNNYFVTTVVNDLDYLLGCRNPVSESGQNFSFQFLLNEDYSTISISFLRTLIEEKLLQDVSLIVEGEKFYISEINRDSVGSGSAYRIKLKETK